LVSLIEKTDNELKTEIYKIFSDETGFTNFNEESVIKGIADSVFRISKFHYEIINKLHKNISLDDAEGFYLDLKGMDFGVLRKLSQKTIRNFKLKSYGSGKIKEGSWIVVDGTDLRFKVLSECNFEADTESLITVEAEFEGSLYNISGAFIIRFTKVFDGVDSLQFITDIIEPGIDIEKDNDYRQRIKDHQKSVTENNVPSKYDTIISKIKGIKDHKVIRSPRGGGSTDVVVSVVSGYNQDDVFQIIRNALEDREVICRDLLIREVTYRDLSLTIEYSGDFVENLVLERVFEYVNQFKIGQVLHVSGKFGLMDFMLDSNDLHFTFLRITPDSDVLVSEYECLKSGNINVLKV